LAVPHAAALYRASGLVQWPVATQIDVGSHVSDRGQSGRPAEIAKTTLLTQGGHQLRRTGDELEEAVKRVYATPAEPSIG
jgi:hypothetical protein